MKRQPLSRNGHAAPAGRRIHGRNGAGSSGSSNPAIWAVSKAALPQAKVKPSAPWPMFSHRLSAAAARPISGLPVGVAGRRPAQGMAWRKSREGKASCTWRFNKSTRAESMSALALPISTLAAIRSPPPTRAETLRRS
ncbi:hypothetical protein G6F31_019832 [Rhizopus arrhizus]|nr:hypothetical protein G6F31_019832 [Rhizopus arrhizus]